MKNFRYVMTGIATISLLGFATVGYANEGSCINPDENGNFPIDEQQDPNTHIWECTPYKPKGNNGWGNGDQDAPGESVDNNNAENFQGSTADNPNGVDGGGGDGTASSPGNSGNNGNNGSK